MLLTPLAGVLFTFQSPYSFTIGRAGVLSLAGWAPHLQSEFHDIRPTQSPSLAVCLQDCHLLWSPFPERWAELTTTHGLFRFRSPLLAESRLISFPPGTEMFQFPGFAPDGLYIQPPVIPSDCSVEPGCPIRRSPDQSMFDHSPELIAAYRVLHRLCTPRHPPYALSSLTTFMKRCGQTAPISTERERSSGRTAARGDRRHRLVNPASIPRHPPMNLSKSFQLSALSRQPIPASRRFPRTAAVPGNARLNRPGCRVEPTGIEPATSALQTRRSPN